MEEFTFDEIFMDQFTIGTVQRYTPDENDANQTVSVEISMNYTGEIPEVCPACASKMYSHGTRELLVTDTPFMGTAAKLRLIYPRRRCRECGYLWSPTFTMVDENHKMTTRAYSRMANMALKRSFADIASEYGTTNNTVKNVFKEFIQEKEEQLRFVTPAFIGLDEIKIKKIGEVTVITDLEHKTMYDMLLGRNQPSLTKYFQRMPNREKVLWVCTDMYRPFEKSIKDAFPNARWVIDHFHVVTYANRAMDRVRIKIQGLMTRTNRIKTKKGLAYTMRTRFRNLTLEEAAKIRECRDNPVLAPLATAFDLKEDFFNIYDNNLISKDNAQKAFAAWEASIPEDEMYEDFRILANTVHNFYEQIFNFWDCPISITNGFTECTNRIIRENNVKGRGNSFEILRGRTLYRNSNLERLENFGMVVGPSIPKNGPVFNFEEAESIPYDTAEDESTYFNSFDYDPFMGLKPGIDFDPTTGEVFDESLFSDEEEEITEVFQELPDDNEQSTDNEE